MWTAIKGFFTTILYQPLYNGLIFLVDIVPGGEVGLAVIALTLIVKFALLPISLKAVKTQADLKRVKPKIDKIKDEHGDDRQKQAEKMMELYSEHDIKPFSGFFLLLLQLPIIFALYYVFLRGGLPELDPTLLYSFIPEPEQVDMLFFGIDIAEASLILAVAAGVSQYVQTTVAQKLSHTEEKEEEIEEEIEKVEETQENKDDFSQIADEVRKNMGSQLRYIFPLIVFAISWSLPAVVALYWMSSNIFQSLQEVYVRKMLQP